MNHKKKMDPVTLKALIITLDLTGTNLSELSMEWLIAELSQYPAASIISALERCRKEVRGRLNPVDILSRFPGGHPSNRPTSVAL